MSQHTPGLVRDRDPGYPRLPRPIRSVTPDRRWQNLTRAEKIGAGVSGLVVAALVSAGFIAVGNAENPGPTTAPAAAHIGELDLGGNNAHIDTKDGVFKVVIGPGGSPWTAAEALGKAEGDKNMATFGPAYEGASNLAGQIETAIEDGRINTDGNGDAIPNTTFDVAAGSPVDQHALPTHKNGPEVITKIG